LPASVVKSRLNLIHSTYEDFPVLLGASPQDMQKAGTYTFPAFSYSFI